MTILLRNLALKEPASGYLQPLTVAMQYFGQPIRWLTDTQVASAIKPIYSKVHPDLFGQYPRAQYINEASLMTLRSHLNTLLEKRQPRSTTLQFYVRDDTSGELDVVTVALTHSEIRSTLQSVLSSFKLPLAPLSKMVEASHDARGPDRTIIYTGRINDAWDHYEPKQRLTLHDWLMKNMWRAEQQTRAAAPVRKDIARLKQRLRTELGVSTVTSDIATSTTRLRGCLSGVLELYRDYRDLGTMLAGRRLHFGNVTGVSLSGAVVLGTAEVKSQWLSFIQQLAEVDAMLSRIPDLQRAVSIGLRGIHVTHRKFGGSVVARGYGHDLKRLVTALSDHRGRHGLPQHWPPSLSHLQLVVEPAWGPMSLSPTGQLLVPSSCPAAQLLTFVSDHLQQAPALLLTYSQETEREKSLHALCQSVFSLEMLEKDDSVVPLEMISCLGRLLAAADTLLPLLTGARVWVTKYYAVMLDGEICLPWHWDMGDEEMRDLMKGGA
ncbi:T-cell activation inhibitor, mitochondrial [Hyalella azteca]|uniref:T-cell activation inhibitor, mitochondrial n=1 Tax=Hyalella azteca TaxID=294128 RepID=A0A979FNQ2_HYAAZ|nr:T-cell activation inhibitor, mitochondrial [Hyalella azteca]